MRRNLLAGAIGCLLVLAAVAGSWAAANLNLSKSNINRFQGAAVMSATVSFTEARVAETFFTVPKVGDFVLTQFCASPANGGIRLAATSFGPLAQTGADLCYTFSPGISLPKGSEVSCSTSAAAGSGDYFCTLSGLLAT